MSTNTKVQGWLRRSIARATGLPLGNTAAAQALRDVVSAGLVKTELVAGQDETGDATIPVTGIAVGDEIVSVRVFDPTGPSFADKTLADLSVIADNIQVDANAANNTGKQYHIVWLDLT